LRIKKKKLANRLAILHGLIYRVLDLYQTSVTTEGPVEALAHSNAQVWPPCYHTDRTHFNFLEPENEKMPTSLTIMFDGKLLRKPRAISSCPYKEHMDKLEYLAIQHYSIKTQLLNVFMLFWQHW